MAIVKQASLVLYRYAEKGLEVFLLDKEENKNLELPQGETSACPECDNESIIALDPVQQKDGQIEQAFAVEGDWHEIPSLKSMLKDDVIFVKDTVKQMIPDMMEKGTFVAVKEALKKVMPHQYEILKELKDTLLERNSLTNM